MRLAQLPLIVACLALFLMSSVAGEDPLKVLSAPNLLRIGATENIFVECKGCPSETQLHVQILVKKFPQGEQLNTTSVSLDKLNKFQASGAIKIPADTFQSDPGLKQHVSLEAKFSDGTILKKVVLVSFQSGYIFIQTDKPLYTPNDHVFYRIFAVTPGMEPFDGYIDVKIMTPEDVVFQSHEVALNSGMYSGEQHLPELVTPGVWKVVATFLNNKHYNSSVEFEVKEYVLPSFEVTITTEKEFFCVDDDQLTVNIKATYLFGKEVSGTAYVIFGIAFPNGGKHTLPGSMAVLVMPKGQAVATLRRSHILEMYNMTALVESSIFITVSVLAKSGSEMMEAEKQGIRIVTSPYTIHFKYTPKYFKPTTTFEAVVNVENPDGSPAIAVELLVGPDNEQAKTNEYGIARFFVNPTENTHLEVRASINDGRQTSPTTMTVLPYTSNSASYLNIVLTSEIRLNYPMQLRFERMGPQTSKFDLTYLVQSRGQLVNKGHRSVVDTCMGSLTLEETSKAPSFTPHQTIKLKITGDPGAIVGLVAVDKGVYVLNNKHRLTQKKVWDTVGKADLGCTFGGGKNSMEVFHDAGLLFKSTINETPDREEFKCPDSTRTKRSPAVLDVRSSLLSEYNNTLEHQCCLDGMVEIPLSYSCERRKEYISDGEACSDAFLKCCQELAKLRTELKTEAFHLARNKTHWPVENQYLITLEATAYALLALVKVKVSITH
ncbi:hypothetical protein CRUP_019419 [Coryphaenoides rupestris]|nr:hypothetical protein CRUP_019419 [Coryphaenoides rupestris]